jgi:hypothetical protein
LKHFQLTLIDSAPCSLSQHESKNTRRKQKETDSSQFSWKFRQLKERRNLLNNSFVICSGFPFMSGQSDFTSRTCTRSPTGSKQPRNNTNSCYWKNNCPRSLELTSTDNWVTDTRHIHMHAHCFLSVSLLWWWYDDNDTRMATKKILLMTSNRREGLLMTSLSCLSLCLQVGCTIVLIL